MGRFARTSGAVTAALALAVLAPAPAAAANGPEPLAIDADAPPERVAARRIPTRAGYAIAEGALPTPASARAVLARRLHATRPGSQAHRDIRYVLRLAARHGKAAQPQGRRATVARVLQVNAWWFAAHGAPSDRIVVADPDGIISTYWEGRGFAINPVATAGRWHGLNARLTPEELAEALLPIGVYRTAGSRRFLLWEYYDVPDKPGVIRPGASGMAQGRMAQLLARAYYRTGNRRYATAARAALAAFTVPVDRGGVESLVRLRPGAPQHALVRRARLPRREPVAGGRPQRLHGHAAQPARATEQRLASRPRPAGEGPAERAPARARLGGGGRRGAGPVPGRPRRPARWRAPCARTTPGRGASTACSPRATRGARSRPT